MWKGFKEGWYKVKRQASGIILRKKLVYKGLQEKTNNKTENLLSGEKSFTRASLDKGIYKNAERSTENRTSISCAGLKVRQPDIKIQQPDQKSLKAWSNTFSRQTIKNKSHCTDNKSPFTKRSINLSLMTPIYTTIPDLPWIYPRSTFLGSMPNVVEQV